MLFRPAAFEFFYRFGADAARRGGKYPQHTLIIPGIFQQLQICYGIFDLPPLEKLLTAERQQTFLLLTIGDHAYGRYRWLVADHKIKLNKFDVNGNLWECLVSVKLVEYLRE